MKPILTLRPNFLLSKTLKVFVTLECHVLLNRPLSMKNKGTPDQTHYPRYKSQYLHLELDYSKLLEYQYCILNFKHYSFNVRLLLLLIQNFQTLSIISKISKGRSTWIPVIFSRHTYPGLD